VRLALTFVWSLNTVLFTLGAADATTNWDRVSSIGIATMSMVLALTAPSRSERRQP
jgi:hypothetical protein